KSLGRQFVESDQFKSLVGSAGQRGKANLEIKATITSATTDAAGSAGDLVQTTRIPGIIAPQDRKLTIRDLLMQGRMDGNALEYVQETGFVNAAGMVAEGALKPQSDIKFDLKSTTAKVIAHYMKASRQILDEVARRGTIRASRRQSIGDESWTCTFSLPPEIGRNMDMPRFGAT